MSARDRGDEPRRRRLPVRSGDVDRRRRELWITEELRERRDALEVGHHALGLAPVELGEGLFEAHSVAGRAELGELREQPALLLLEADQVGALTLHISLDRALISIEHEGDFAEGQESEHPDHPRRGSFAEGQEDDEDDDKREGSFAEGQEQDE